MNKPVEIVIKIKDNYLDTIKQISISNKSVAFYGPALMQAVKDSKPYEKQKGEWNWSGNNGNGRNYYNCSVCGRLIEANREELINFPYCHCGAKMKIKKEKIAYEE